MKNLKKIAVVAMLGMMCIGGYSAYEYTLTTDATRLMMENVEALTQDEVPGAVSKYCQKTGSSEQIGCFANNTGAHCRKHSDCSNI
ncbi:MAG: hypothetical protein RR259_11220 [Odoribacter sp.]